MSGIMVDAMPGDTDDEKLAAAIERATAMCQAADPPTLVDLLLAPRAYTFRQTLPPIPEGVRIVGHRVAVQLEGPAAVAPLSMRSWRLSDAYIGGPSDSAMSFIRVAHQVTHHSTRVGMNPPRWRMTCDCGWYLDPAPRSAAERNVVERAHQRSGM